MGKPNHQLLFTATFLLTTSLLLPHPILSDHVNVEDNDEHLEYHQQQQQILPPQSVNAIPVEDPHAHHKHHLQQEQLTNQGDIDPHAHHRLQQEQLNQDDLPDPHAHHKNHLQQEQLTNQEDIDPHAHHRLQQEQLNQDDLLDPHKNHLQQTSVNQDINNIVPEDPHAHHKHHLQETTNQKEIEDPHAHHRDNQPEQASTAAITEFVTQQDPQAPLSAIVSPSSKFYPRVAALPPNFLFPSLPVRPSPHHRIQIDPYTFLQITPSAVTSSHEGNQQFQQIDRFWDGIASAASIVPKLFGDTFSAFWVPHAYFNMCPYVTPADPVWAHGCAQRPFTAYPNPQFGFAGPESTGSVGSGPINPLSYGMFPFTGQYNPFGSGGHGVGGAPQLPLFSGAYGYPQQNQPLTIEDYTNPNGGLYTAGIYGGQIPNSSPPGLFSSMTMFGSGNNNNGMYTATSSSGTTPSTQAGSSSGTPLAYPTAYLNGATVTSTSSSSQRPSLTYPTAYLNGGTGGSRIVSVSVSNNNGQAEIETVTSSSSTDDLSSSD